MDKKLPVKIINYEKAKKLLTHQGDETVFEAYNNYALDWQKELVQFKKERFDRNRIIILEGKKVIDGNHHLIAAIKNKQNIKYVDLNDL